MTSARYFRRPDMQTLKYLKNARRAGFVLQARSPPILVTRDKRNRKVESTCTITAALTRWDEKAGLPRDAIRSQ
jgi:hypothetical protein